MPAPAPFIVGAGAADTALLRAMLDAHPQLAIASDTTFSREFFRDAARGKADAAARAAEVRGFYAAHAARRGKPRWGDATPSYILCMGAIQRLLPEARCVQVVRDGRDALCAQRATGVSGGAAQATSFALYWQKCLRHGRKLAARASYLEVRYEALRDDSEAVLRRVCDFLELDFDAAALQAARARPGPAAPEWREALAPADVLAFERTAAATLEELGYPVSTGSTKTPSAGPIEAERSFERGVRREKVHDWEGALAGFAEAARQAPENPTYVGRQANLLERTGRLGEAWDALSRWARLVSPSLPNEWSGGPVAGKRVLLRRKIRHVAAEIRQARFIAPLVRDARACTVLVEPRLKALFARSFPGAHFITEGEALPEADCSLGYEDLASIYGRTERAMGEGFVPLATDASLVEELRAYYRAPRERLVGIAWASSNDGKRLPRLEDWRPLLEARAWRFVSLQYGEAERGAATLEALSGTRVIVDPAVDQLTNMDRFAAQIAALDAVVTISCTAAHLAGALGKPTLVLFDEDDAQTWQHGRDTSPWYPTLHIRRRVGGEAWPAVMADARTILEGLA